MSQPKKSIIEVQDAVVTILSGQQEDYINLTDIRQAADLVGGVQVAVRLEQPGAG